MAKLAPVHHAFTFNASGYWFRKAPQTISIGLCSHLRVYSFCAVFLFRFINRNRNRRVQKERHLGVVINNSLSWSDHIDDVFTKCARHVGILNSLRKKLSKRCLTRIYKGYIRPRLEYACAVWSGGNTSKLLKLQQKFCRQHQVQLPNLSNRFKFHTLTLFYKIRNGLAPTYLSEILPETLALSSGRNLRRHVYPFPRINKSSTMQSLERFSKPNIRFGSGRTGSKIVSKFRLIHNRKLRSANRNTIDHTIACPACPALLLWCVENRGPCVTKKCSLSNCASPGDSFCQVLDHG